MAIVRWNRQSWDPFHALEDLHGEMNRLFNTSLSRFPEDPSRRLTDVVWTPAMDIYETKDDLVVNCELPGLKLQEINVTIRDNTLCIEGERKQATEVQAENFYRMERWAGKFYRAIDLPQMVEAEKINATYEHGVLTVTMPKKAEVKPRQIQVKVS